MINNVNHYIKHINHIKHIKHINHTLTMLITCLKPLTKPYIATISRAKHFVINKNPNTILWRMPRLVDMITITELDHGPGGAVGFKVHVANI